MEGEGIGGRIRRIRIDKRMSRSCVAERVGISKESLGRYEREERQISAVVLLKIAEFFDCPPNDLLGKPSNIEAAEKAS